MGVLLEALFQTYADGKCIKVNRGIELRPKKYFPLARYQRQTEG